VAVHYCFGAAEYWFFISGWLSNVHLSKLAFYPSIFHTLHRLLFQLFIRHLEDKILHRFHNVTHKKTSDYVVPATSSHSKRKGPWFTEYFFFLVYCYRIQSTGDTPTKRKQNICERVKMRTSQANKSPAPEHERHKWTCQHTYKLNWEKTKGHHLSSHV